MFINTTYRTEEKEIMDDLSLHDAEIKDVFEDINTVNHYLGGNKITLNGIQQLIKNIPKGKEITITDLGCGDGEMLAYCARYARKYKHNFKLSGIDINPQIIEEAKEKMKNFPEITFINEDVYSKEFAKNKVDIFLCTLTLHHFDDNQIENLLATLSNQARLGIVINDLHRNKLAYGLFKMFSSFFLKTKIAKNDGLVSILRGFKRKELETFSNKLNSNKHTINWKWAFRYQWIIQKQ
ncbi:MAG: class I SAM-dependent methyltransferase [Flavobacteriaceae bacterium]